MDDYKEETKDHLVPPLQAQHEPADANHSPIPRQEQPPTDHASRIGFREFVPGADHAPVGTDKDADPIVIPEFDLNQQMMAAQRKQASTKRRGPGRQDTRSETGEIHQTHSAPERPQVDDAKIDDNARRKPYAMHTIRHPLIAEIVRRDIERLCRSR